jgi:Protein of unknown function (DUF1579)
MSRSIRSLGVIVLGLGVVGVPRLAHGQEGSQIPKPTDEHKALAKDVGTWDATIKSWAHGPDSQPTESKGVEVVKLMPGGLWQQSEFDGKLEDMEFHGCGVTGYDAKKKKYVGTWVDSMSAEIMSMEGDYDASTKTMTMYSKMSDPSGKAHDAKMTSKHEDDDTRVFTLLMKTDETKGGFVKVLEITYKRRAK